jgi:hypothetical protein
MKWVIKTLSLIIVYGGITTILNSCSSTKITNPLLVNILKSKSAIVINEKEFEKYKIDTFFVYLGYGNIVNMQANRLTHFIVPRFEKILYDPLDSTLFVKGIIYYEGDIEINSHAQILIGKIIKIPETLKDIGKIDISYNYHANEKGEFSLAVKVKDQRQIIFAEKIFYDENGESDIIVKVQRKMEYRFN